MIRILIVDDQNLVQQGIKSLLERDLDFKVIGTVKDGRNAVQQIAQIHPDIVLLDIEMPGMDGITTTKYINRVSPKTKVIILSSHEDKKYVTRALMAGAKGYILKTSLMTDLKQAISAVNNGYSQIDSRLLAKVFDPQNIRIKKVRSDTEETKVNSNKENKTHLNTEEPKVSSKTEETKVHSDTEETKVSSETEETKVYSNTEENKAYLEPQKSQINSHSEETEVNLDNSLEQQSESTVDSWQTNSSTLSSVSEQSKEHPPETAQSDSTIQSTRSEAILSEVKVEPSAQNTFSQNRSDAVILKQTAINENSNRENDSRTQSPYIASQTVLAPARKKSLKQKKLTSFSLLFKRKTSATITYWKKLSNKLKRAIRESNIERTKFQLHQYKAKLSLLTRQKKKQPLLWTIGLVILGIVIGVILGG